VPTAPPVPRHHARYISFGSDCTQQLSRCGPTNAEERGKAGELLNAPAPTRGLGVSPDAGGPWEASAAAVAGRLCRPSADLGAPATLRKLGVHVLHFLCLLLWVSTSCFIRQLTPKGALLMTWKLCWPVRSVLDRVQARASKNALEEA